MRLSDSTVLLKLLWWILHLTSAASQTDTACLPSNQNLTASSQANIAGLECAQVNPMAWPKKEDCINAILQTPESGVLATFRTGEDAPPEYRLPQSYQAGRCQVSFELLSGVDREMSSWQRLNHAADRLIFACAPAARTKGSILVGKIKITSLKLKDSRPASCASIESEQVSRK